MINNNANCVSLGVYATMLCKLSVTKTLEVGVRVTKMDYMSHASFYMGGKIKQSQII
jgi:hypothetical protein